MIRNTVLVGLVALGLTTDSPPDPSVRSNDSLPIQASPTPSPSETDPPGWPATVPYDTHNIKQAALRLMAFKGMTEAQYRADPASLLVDNQDLGRLMAYLAVLTYAEGRTRWAILHYCQAIKADPRYISLEGIPSDSDETFMPSLQVIRLEALKYFANRVSRELKVMPSRLRRNPGGQDQ